MLIPITILNLFHSTYIKEEIWYLLLITLSVGNLQEKVVTSRKICTKSFVMNMIERWENNYYDSRTIYKVRSKVLKGK